MVVAVRMWVVIDKNPYTWLNINIFCRYTGFLDKLKIQIKINQMIRIPRYQETHLHHIHQRSQTHFPAPNSKVIDRWDNLIIRITIILPIFLNFLDFRVTWFSQCFRSGLAKPWFSCKLYLAAQESDQIELNIFALKNSVL